MAGKTVWKKISEVTETVIENFLWNFRLIIVLGVIGLIVCSTVVFVMGILETYNVVVHLYRTYLSSRTSFSRDLQ